MWRQRIERHELTTIQNTKIQETALCHINSQKQTAPPPAGEAVVEQSDDDQERNRDIAYGYHIFHDAVNFR